MRLRRNNSLHGSGVEAINVTPLIDVVMCLIIFFLIVGKLAGDRGMPVKLPTSGIGQEERSPKVLIITVARNAAVVAPGSFAGVQVQVDGERIEDIQAFQTMVRGRLAQTPTLSVQVRADRDLAYGLIEPVLAAAAKGGAKSVRLATERVP